MRPSLYYDARLKSVILTANGERFVIEYLGKELFLPADSANAAYYDKILKQGEKEETGLIGLVSQVRRKTTPAIPGRVAFTASTPIPTRHLHVHSNSTTSTTSGKTTT